MIIGDVFKLLASSESKTTFAAGSGEEQRCKDSLSFVLLEFSNSLKRVAQFCVRPHLLEFQQAVSTLAGALLD